MLPYLHEVLLEVPTEIQKKREGKSAENISSYEPTREAFISAKKKKNKDKKHSAAQNVNMLAFHKKAPV